MTTLANNNIVAVRFYTFHVDQQGVNVLHYRTSAVVNNPTTAHFASLLGGTMPALYKSLLNDEAVYVGLTVQRIFPGPTAIADVDVTGGGNGNAGATPIPRQCSGLVTKRTALAGQRYRGRVYLPFPSEDDNDGTVALPTAGYVTRANTWSASALAPWAVSSGGNTCTMTPVLWHNDTQTYDDVAGYRVREFWASQLRRGSFGPVNPFPLT